MPPPRLGNRYYLVRAGESEYELAGVVNTNPVAKTSVDNGLSAVGARQAARSALELQRLGACDDSCWIWPSITQRSYQAAEIIAAVNGVDRRIKRKQTTSEIQYQGFQRQTEQGGLVHGGRELHSCFCLWWWM